MDLDKIKTEDGLFIKGIDLDKIKTEDGLFIKGMDLDKIKTEIKLFNPMQKMSDYQGKYLDITGKIINAAMEVHKALGPGYQEIIYHKAMIIALSDRGLKCESEKEFYIFFKNRNIGMYKLDLIVGGKVIVELKAVVGEMPEVFKAQVISYLKASGLEVALLINFGNESLDIRRLVRYKDYQKPSKSV